MTTQAELKALAASSDNEVVQVLLLQIQECEATARQHCRSARAYLEAAEPCIAGKKGFYVGLTHTDVVTHVHLFASAMSELNRTYFNLATVLQKLGYTIDY